MFLSALSRRISNDPYIAERLRVGIVLALHVQYTAPLGWAMVFFVAYGKMPLSALYGWVGAFAIAEVVCIGTLKWLARRPTTDHITLLGIGAVSTLDAAMWASLCWAAMGYDLVMDALVAIFMFVIIALNAPGRALVMSGMVLQTCTLWLGTLTYSLQHLDRPLMTELSLGLSIYSLVIMTSVHRLGKMLGESIRLRLDNEALSSNLRLTLQEVEQQAITDTLTRVANRRAFDAALERISRGERTADSSPVSFVALDLDHFKQVNDRYGHRVGDEALLAFADRVRAQLRPRDMLARVGGEEFVALIYGADLAEAMAVAQRICNAMASAPLLQKPPLTLTVSIGVAQHQPELEGIQQALHRADRALYEAKHGGRNRVCLAQPAQHGTDSQTTGPSSLLPMA